MQHYCHSTTQYTRLQTRQIEVGNLPLGSQYPIRIQTMTTTNTMHTAATVAQAISCIKAGAELIRIATPSKKEAENLLHIKNALKKRGYVVPIVADVHFTPNAAEIAARIVEKVRINPGNYIDKKKFQSIQYTNADYNQEIDRIRQKFIPLIHICKQYGTAMRIGTNHGSLSDRIMSRYGDTAIGMVESAMEFLRIARNENYHQIVLSIKASNTQIMVQAYRLLVQTMCREFNEVYPLHLGVTEAGEGEDGRIKSAIGIGTLLADGLGDTIRVSLTESPELEIPVCKTIINYYQPTTTKLKPSTSNQPLLYNALGYNRRKTIAVGNIGAAHPPVVVADLSKLKRITPKSLKAVGYTYNAVTDKWSIDSGAADYIFTGYQILPFSIPQTLGVIVYASVWQNIKDKVQYFPLFSTKNFTSNAIKSSNVNFLTINCSAKNIANIHHIAACASLSNTVLCFTSTRKYIVYALRKMFMKVECQRMENPVIIMSNCYLKNPKEHLIYHAIQCGALLMDGFGDGICLSIDKQNEELKAINLSNQTAFGILQASRIRTSKTEYISCPSCGRTLFDLQKTTAKIRAATQHLKGVKIAIMGCIVNGPGEMADADFGYVGSGPEKITLYRGKEIVKRNIDSGVAVAELINLIKEHNLWVDP